MTLLGGETREFYKGELVLDYTQFWWWDDGNSEHGIVLCSNHRWFLPEGEVDEDICRAAMPTNSIPYKIEHEGRENVGEKIAFRNFAEVGASSHYRWLVFNAAKRVVRRLTDDEYDKAKESASYWFQKLQSRILHVFIDIDTLRMCNWSAVQIAEAHKWFDTHESGNPGPIPEHVREIFADALYNPHPLKSKFENTCCDEMKLVTDTETASSEASTEAPRKYRSLVQHCAVCGTQRRTEWRDGVETPTDPKEADL